VAIPIVLAVVALLVVIGSLVVATRRRSGHGPDVPERGGVAASPRPVGVEAPPRPAAPPREGLGARVRSLFGGRAATEEDWKDLEDLLIRSDVGPAVASELTSRVRVRYTPEGDIEDLLVSEVAGLLEGDTSVHVEDGVPVGWMIGGVPGSGAGR
jgi:hypothetical protein